MLKFEFLRLWTISIFYVPALLLGAYPLIFLFLPIQFHTIFFELRMLQCIHYSIQWSGTAPFFCPESQNHSETAEIIN